MENKNMKKVFFVSILMVGGFVFAGNALASATITSVKLNGSGDATANPASKVTATVNVNLTSPSVWRSTAYRIGEGDWNCIDTPDHSGNTNALETFPITAPRQAGTNNVNFQIYENNNCTNGLDIASASASLLTSVTNIFSFAQGGMWLFILIVIILVVAIFYIAKIIIGEKTKISEGENK